MNEGLAPRLAAWLADTTGDAAAILAAARAETDDDPDLWHRFLTTTANAAFLGALPDRSARYAWAEVVFDAIERARFTLASLMDWRATERGERIYLRDLGQPGEPAWSYATVRRRTRQLAAHFLGPDPGAAPHPTAPGRPRVAIVATNGLQSACCDLACLLHDILVTPLSVHESTDSLTWISDRLAITDLVVDGPDLLQRALEVRDQAVRPPRIHLISSVPTGGADAVLLEAALADLKSDEVDRRLAERPRFSLREPCTVMFTSGSTGRPKGIAFSQFNLVSKRFARAAALPRVGNDETLLSYLPLFHTFGRYLELLGMLSWGGTYVFAGNPSVETLLNQMPLVRPTGMISVPLRWQQLRDRALAVAGEEGDPGVALNEVTGGRLRWGLSAAGYLDPVVFRFFQRHGVELCSGFGMTEGTGGLTMTPPGEYVEESVGIPLPGVRVAFGDQDELRVAGPYVARYLEEDAPHGDLTVERPEADDVWIGTGDLFRVLPGDHLQIVDRIKDIYKNNRGQTIAPRKVEARFEGTPGITRTFLAGDGRAYNTLLIVPDDDDPILQALAPTERHEYFQRLITQANLDLAPYERVVGFALLDRDFDAEQGELTPKDSYRRKQITRNFAPVVEDLYRSDRRELTWQGHEVIMPRWVLRDLSALEDTIRVDDDGLIDTRRGVHLPLARGQRTGWVRIGNLEYHLAGGEARIDLGLFAKQPLLWLGNPALTTFLPCKGGWDHGLEEVSDQVLLPERTTDDTEVAPRALYLDPRLAQLDLLCRDLLYGKPASARVAAATLVGRLPQAPPHEAAVIRRRLEAMANHPRQDLRCQAYLALLLDQPEPDYDRYLPAFIYSGKSFLCENSIATIAHSSFESRRLLALRRRLHRYREWLSWPATPAVRSVFADLLRLLTEFGRENIEYYSTVRRELACWIVFDRDPELAACALRHLQDLGAWYEHTLIAKGQHDGDWSGKLAYQDGLGEAEIARLQRVIVGTTFLQGSVQLAFSETLDPQDIPAGGIWISRTVSKHFSARYRVSINLAGGSHYDLMVIIRDDLHDLEVMRTFYWMIAMRAYPQGNPVVPRFGYIRPDLGAVSLAFESELAVWDRIRMHAQPDASHPLDATGWRHLLVAGIATMLRAWLHGNRRLIPGTVMPTNVIVPDPDWREDRLVINLAGSQPYRGPLSLVRPLLKNFLHLPANHYPGCAEHIRDTFVLEAVAEALGPTDARAFLVELERDLAQEGLPEAGPDFPATVGAFIAQLAEQYRPPLALENAIARYGAWHAANPDASPAARVDQLEALARLYHLTDLGEPARYALYRRTYFADASPEVAHAFARLQKRLFQSAGLRAAQTVELSDLQNALDDADDRLAFRRLAFPHATEEQQPQVTTVGDRERRHVVLRTTLTDDRGSTYECLEPRTPAEIGRLYRLFLFSGFPLSISAQDHHLLVLDAREQLVGGIVYRPDTGSEPHLEGVVVTRTLRGRGLARALIDDFCRRMAAEGHTLVRTHFSLLEFFGRQGFDVDRAWGGLVRHLG